MIKLNPTTWKHVQKDDWRERLEVIIGGDKQDLKPQIKIQKWDNEVNASFRLVDDEKIPPIIRKDGKKLKYIKKKKEIHFYHIEPNEKLKEGGFEFEVILKEKPDTNKLHFTINTKGLRFYYQPPLTEEITEEEKKRGWTATETEIRDEKGNVVFYRPEEVVGSYAVYHGSKSSDYSKIGCKNYRAGKVFHIYRPKIIDAKGNWTWGKLNINEKKRILTIEIDQSFLDKAVYPVKVDPTFGYDTAGSSLAQLNPPIPSGPGAAWYLRGSWFTCPENGLIENITAYLKLGDEVGKTQFGIYKKSDNSLVGTTPSTTVFEGTGWRTINFTTQYSLEGNVDYWLVAASDQSDDAGNPAYIYYDSQSSKGGCQGRNSSWIDDFPDPWSPTSEDKIYSIYCTYTALAGAKNLTLLHVGT